MEKIAKLASSVTSSPQDESLPITLGKLHALCSDKSLKIAKLAILSEVFLHNPTVFPTSTDGSIQRYYS